MFVDLLGKTRIKLALHVSSSEDVIKCIDKGYDAIALTENWKYTGEVHNDGIKLISGCEYSVGGFGEGERVYHILGIGMTSDPEVPSAWKNMKKTARSKAVEIIKMIQKRNGMAIIAFPMQNRNSAEELLELEGFDGIEIYNSEIEYGADTNGYAGGISDRLSLYSVEHIIVASNGNTCYEGEEFLCSLMVEATDMDTDHIVRALKQGRFYSTEGPEIHLERVGADKVVLTCSPAVKIEFFSDIAKGTGKTVNGEALIGSEYVIKNGERFVRAEITDENGLRAWSNIIRFDELYR